MRARFVILVALAFITRCGTAQTNTTAVASTNIFSATQVEQMRTACIEGRRYICGRVMQVSPDGIVVDSGFTSLLKPPLHTSWVVPANVSATRESGAVEGRAPDSPCIGLVFVTDIPKKPAVNLYDYVVLHAYPAGQYVYTPVPPVQKNIRKFSAGLDTAIKLTLQSGK